MTLRYGDIVMVANLSDPHGRNPKGRPAVIVTPNDELQAGRPISIVAITTTLPDPLPDDYVPLPWQHRPRHPRTGLNKRNAAVCHWMKQVEEAQVMYPIGLVPTKQLAIIEEVLSRLPGETQ